MNVADLFMNMRCITKESDVVSAENLGTFYRFVNKKLTCKTGVGALYDTNGNLVTDDEQKANVKYFLLHQFVLLMTVTMLL